MHFLNNGLEFEPIELWILAQSQDDNTVKWKERLIAVGAEGGFLVINSVIRGLTGLKNKNKKLNRTQNQALRILMERLLKEWAARLYIDKQSAKPKPQVYLKENIS